MAASRSLSSSSEALPASDSDMSADEAGGSAAAASKGQENRIASLHQANRVLKMELEMYKLRCKQMLEENKMLRQASVSIVSCFVFSLLLSAAIFLAIEL